MHTSPKALSSASFISLVSESFSSNVESDVEDNKIIDDCLIGLLLQLRKIEKYPNANGLLPVLIVSVGVPRFSIVDPIDGAP